MAIRILSMVMRKKLLIAGFFLAFALSGVLSAVFPNNVRIEPNLWFGADIGRVINDMAEPLANHYRLKVHPLFSLIVLPVARPVYWIGRLMGFDGGLSKGIAAQFVTSMSAGATWILIYLLAIRMGLSRFASLGISLLFLSSTAFLFWWSTPETFPLGAVTILLPLILLAYNIKSHKVWVMALVGSLSMTTTNWGAGLIASLVRFGLRKAFLGLCGMTLLLTSLLICVQKAYLPSAGLPFQLGEERTYIKRSVRPFETAYQFFVAPVAPLTPSVIIGEGRYSQFTFALPGWSDISLLRISTATAWLALLFNGIYAALSRRDNSVSIALACFLGFQFLLHSFYGDSPFLYSAHYVPAMVLLAGYGLTAMPEAHKKSITLLVYVLALILLPLNLVYLYESFKLGVAHLAG
ncbi:hypothetical protein KBZ12_09360 [Cyanobium sp. Cruz CV13-4-11]|uniref:hypothetical protein n=1 Tax=unclassified Cyanobium TaxID=2627006 RepID=UPI0020CB98BA|nr:MULTISPECIES: hypothetical protein [unclassified Cyanobium]MCP9900594.1 hypothetical protein [Cyanobium sp. Cruz CV11-17]MCP9919687.1 hypothetical protein [Cyanobium sp. Cruz CV13-4-11]